VAEDPSDVPMYDHDAIAWLRSASTTASRTQTSWTGGTWSGRRLERAQLVIRHLARPVLERLQLVLRRLDRRTLAVDLLIDFGDHAAQTSP
jgi:hypothetical protein